MEQSPEPKPKFIKTDSFYMKNDNQPSFNNPARRQRPMTAKVESQSATAGNRRSYGNRYAESLGAIDVARTKIILHALGQYIASKMRQGKGVAIPKLGQFTFTSMTVDLAGSTNPQIRDQQERFPVFIIAKDFNPSNPIKAGICSGMTPEIFQEDSFMGNNTQIRIYGGQGASGIIPKVKVNYFEVAAFSDGSVNKEQCKMYLELVVKKMSDTVRKGGVVNEVIPQVGTLKIKNGVAGIVFDKVLLEDTRGTTAKQYEKLFHKNNWMNPKIYEPNFTNYGQTAKSTDHLLRGSFQVTSDAKDWLKNSLGIEYDNFKPLPTNRAIRASHDFTQTMRKTESKQYLSNKMLQKQNENELSYTVSPQTRKRPQSAVSSAQSKVFSRNSHSSSAITRLPDLAPFELMNLANEIHNYRAAMITTIRNGIFQFTLRDHLSSSQIQNLLKQAGFSIHIGNLKALLKEFGFPYNGKSCSVQQLIQTAQAYINPHLQKKQEELDKEKKETRDVILGHKVKQGPSQIISIIKDLLYSNGQSLYSTFNQNAAGDSLSFEAFKNLINNLSQSHLSEEHIKTAFSRVADYERKDQISYKAFETAFAFDLPTRGSMQSEVKVLKEIREWMFQRQMGSNSAWDRLLRSADRFHEKTLRLQDLHRSITVNDIPLSAPQIDFLFECLTQKDGVIDQEDWFSKIFDDSQNPLQVIRETIVSQNLNIDDILFQMKIKIWDDALDFNKFTECLRRLDPSFSNGQCKTLFQKIKGADGLVNIEQMISNFLGSFQDTVDFKNKMFKLLYREIHQKNRADQLMKELEEKDSSNDGKILPKDLEKVLKKVTGGTESSFSDEDLLKFSRQLHKDPNNKISYNEFVEQMNSMGSKSHNPFRTCVQRVAFFLESNKMTINKLLDRLSPQKDPVSVKKFAEFLRLKIEKNKDISELIKYSRYIDIDKDGYITPHDLKTCLRNLNSNSFFKDEGKALEGSQLSSELKFFSSDASTSDSNKLSEDKVIEICDLIRNVIRKSKMNIIQFWQTIDTKHGGLINLSQFSKAINTHTPVAANILEKVFSMMDQNKIGMVDFDKFKQIIQIQTLIQIPRGKEQLSDSFEWQEMVINSIKNWITGSKLSAHEAFKSFDVDFDGLISKEDMRTSLTTYLKIRQAEITQNRLDRLFKLMSFFKTDYIQPSDFSRLLQDQNPYYTVSTGASSVQFEGSMGGGFKDVKTQDWKYSVIQQIGLAISQHYGSVDESFNVASKNSDRLDFLRFEEFLNSSQILQGFNLTKQLLLKVFAALDPHKKTYLTLKDWVSSFQLFDHNTHLIVELKNFMQCQFQNKESAFGFLQSVEQTQEISFSSFCKAVRSMLPKRVLNRNQMLYVFQSIAQEKRVITKVDFFQEMKNVKFSGLHAVHILPERAQRQQQKVQNDPMNNKNKLSSQKLSANSSKWEQEIIEKIKVIISRQGKSMEAIFRQIDVDDSGLISADEFVRAIKLVSIHITNQDIKKLMDRIDSDASGAISYLEFAKQFRDDKEFDERMKRRANNKLAELKQQIVMHMKSPTDAFYMFDDQNKGQISFTDFDRMLTELARLSQTEKTSFIIIKDLFDAIDSNCDQIIDTKEWNSAFGNVQALNRKLVVKTTPLSIWENTLEAHQIAACLAKNRKLLIESFKQNSTHTSHDGEPKYVTFIQAKKAVTLLLEKNFNFEISDAKLDCLLQVGQVMQKIGRFPDTKIYDFMQILNIYQKRHLGPLFK